MLIRELVQRMLEDGSFNRVVNNPLAQFGPPARNYLGASLLPERRVPQNRYTEQGIRYRTIIANHADRYSPVQIKGGVLTGSMEVTLADNDIGSQFTGQDYDALVDLLARNNANNPPLDGMITMTNWADATLNLPLLERNEKDRWDAIVDSKVYLRGDNNFTQDVQLEDPAGHRVNAAGNWDSDAYDPMDDITAGVDFLSGKGYTVNRIITGRSVISKLQNNAKMQTRAGILSIIAGTVVGMRTRLSLQDINGLLAKDNLPAIEEYNLQYFTSASSGYFLKRNVMVLVATTGRDETIALPDTDPLIVQNTLGYTGIGRAQGQQDAGRVVKARTFDDTKPVRVEGEAWQTSFPVVAEPEAIYVIKAID